jgi:hypothetical protein
MRPTILSLLLLLALAAPLSPALAQSLILRPAVVPLKGETGQSVTQVLALQNDSDVALDFVMQAKDVVVRDGARQFVEAGRLPDSIAATAVFQPPSIRVEPHSSGSVTATFTLPPSMRHRAVVALFRGTTPVTSGKRKALMSLGTLFTFTVSDRVSIKAGALELLPASRSANAQLRSDVVNDGTEPAVPGGMAVILDEQGRLAGKIPFRTKRLLPGEAATLVADFPGELPSGNYRAVATFDVAGHPLTLTSPLAVP